MAKDSEGRADGRDNDFIQELREALNKPRKRQRKARVKRYAYEPCLISYLDVLGMKDLLTSSGSDASKVAEVLDCFRSYSQPDDHQKRLWKAGFVNFSDLALRSIPINTEANTKHRLGCFFHEVMDLGFIQINLINRGILVRGAMTIGLLCQTKQLVFGPGLAEAHLLESKAARYPRIIVSESMMKAVEDVPVLRGRGNSYKEEMEYLRSFLRRDEDGVWFLDYLAHIRNEADNHYEYASFLLKHQALIEAQRTEIAALTPGLPQTESRVEKLKWMISLHNTHLQENDAGIFLQETELDMSVLDVMPLI
jgi:hypothetical protein